MVSNCLFGMRIADVFSAADCLNEDRYAQAEFHCVKDEIRAPKTQKRALEETLPQYVLTSKAES